MDPNAFGLWVAQHWVELFMAGVITMFGFLARRVVNAHDEAHKELDQRLTALEAVKPVTVEQLDQKLAHQTDQVYRRLDDLQKTQHTILDNLLNGGR